MVFSQQAQTQKLALEQQLLEQEKSLAGFNPLHYIRPTIEAEIKKLKAKIEVIRNELDNPLTLKQQLLHNLPTTINSIMKKNPNFNYNELTFQLADGTDITFTKLQTLKL